MLRSALFNKRGSSSSQIDIEDISDGIMRLPGGHYRLVLAVGSINFGLKSEDEQDALVDTYEDFLNSLGFAIQLLIRTREIDMDAYLQSLKTKIADEPVAIYRQQLKSYRQFIASLISTNKILSRQFYVIIPYEAAKTSDRSLIKSQLGLRADIILKNLSRLGIGCRELTSLELIDLFYSFYSPRQAKIQPLSERAFNVLHSEFILKKRG